MSVTDLFVISVFYFPIAALIATRFVTINYVPTILKFAVCLFALHNYFYEVGYSVRGDSFDYYVFSMEYLTLCLIICFVFKGENEFTKMLFAIPAIGIVVVMLATIMSGWILSWYAQAYESNKQFQFMHQDISYETRMYSIGSVTSTGNHIFKTYKIYNYIPIEQLIDSTAFSGDSELNFGNTELKIDFIDIDNQKNILFQSNNGQNFTKPL